ncbi:hypothetical protein [Harryflintia acetispora]|uniref:Uncharacterized protein n=1 Tax=Harryflintia acetispora TaxID=1849041 RepID=A0A9X8Y8T6_9FIRM|nr:hypothetical protein [Harryflintia acetispora]TCL44458.1 hypothetical protein EDD78_10276 [Harryflintia acetispora]
MDDIEKLAKEERNAYFRRWRAENKDKVRAINMRYWEKRAEAKFEKKVKENG